MRLDKKNKGNVEDILKCAGSWKISKEEAYRITKAIYEDRKKGNF